MQAVEWLLRSAARSGQSDDETGNRLRRREIQREPCAAEGRQRDNFVRSRTAAGAARASAISLDVSSASLPQAGELGRHRELLD